MLRNPVARAAPAHQLADMLVQGIVRELLASPEVTEPQEHEHPDHRPARDNVRTLPSKPTGRTT